MTTLAPGQTFTSPLTPPLPSGLRHLAGIDRPIHIGSAKAARLLEFWGFTENGAEYLRKLVINDVVKPVRLSHSRNLRYLTLEVLAVWENEKE
jgi:hypothetical protein